MKEYGVEGAPGGDEGGKKGANFGKIGNAEAGQNIPERRILIDRTRIACAMENRKSKYPSLRKHLHTQALSRPEGDLVPGPHRYT